MRVAVAEKGLSKAILERRATRQFEPTQVSEERLQEILQAGLAGSALGVSWWCATCSKENVCARPPWDRRTWRRLRSSLWLAVTLGAGKTETWTRCFRLAAAHGYGGPDEHEAALSNILNFLADILGSMGGIGPDLAV